MSDYQSTILSRAEAVRLAEEIAVNSLHDKLEFPVDVHQIAQDHDIQICPKNVNGVSGGIIFKEPPVIFYSTTANNLGFERFSIAHELGHYFMDGHHAVISENGHWSNISEADTNPIEQEANLFASHLLMPDCLLNMHFKKYNFDLDGIIALANFSHASLLASAIRTANFADVPLAIVVSNANTVEYSFLSDSLSKLPSIEFLRKNFPLPQTATSRLNHASDEKRVDDTSYASEWFNADPDFSLVEEAIRLYSLDKTLTILYPEDELPEEYY